jgi:hypothetical protein
MAIIQTTQVYADELVGSVYAQSARRWKNLKRISLSRDGVGSREGIEAEQL